MRPGLLLPLVLMLLTARAPAQAAPEQEVDFAALRAAFVELLAVDVPAARAKAAAELARARGVDVATWERALAALPRPPLPLDEPLPEGVSKRTLRLWAGPHGMVDVEVHCFMPKGERPQQGHGLLLACHGTGGMGSGELGIWHRFATRVPLIVLAPTEPGENSGYRFSEDERQVHLSVLRWALLHLPVDRDRVMVCGTSRGGHASWDLALRHPDPWAAILPCIGSPRLSLVGGQNNLRLLDNVVHLTIRDLQGLGDDPAMIWNIRLAFKELERLGARAAKLYEFEGYGHSYTFDGTDVAEVLADARRDPHPTMLHLAASREAEARRAWVRITAFDKVVEDAFRLKVHKKEWEAKDEEQKKLYVHEQALAKTARVQAQAVREDEVLRIKLETEAVRRVALELPRWLWTDPPPGRLLVDWKGRVRRLAPKPDVALYLTRMAEHLDPDRAPVAVVGL
ncbi:MAG: hypothetical protein R3F30_15770 [Planctomycetota bacterium]